MAYGINISSVISKLNKDANKLLQQVDDEILKGLQEVVVKAKAEAPAFIAPSINVEKKGELQYSLNAENRVSAYFEFGTGPYAEKYIPGIEQEWQLIASDYIVNKQGTTPENPYMYPSYQSVMPRVFEKIQKDLNA